jgi:AmiR/NasT family two-component response regulator
LTSIRERVFGLRWRASQTGVADRGTWGPLGQRTPSSSSRSIGRSGVWPRRIPYARLGALEKTAKNTDEAGLERLRILVADGREEILDEVAHTVSGLGHDVVGEADLGDVAALTASVIVGESSAHALDLIGRIVTEASCPVIAILDVEDEAFIHEAARRGIFAYITMGRGAAALQSSLDVVLSRFAEYHGLEGAFARRAITERAKGILMERHGIDEKQAFTMLRDEARRTNRKITDVAEAVAISVTLLPARPGE